MEKRIQKAISESGFCSRRMAESLITQKRIKVNGRLATIGMKINPLKDNLVIDDEKISFVKKKEYLYLIMNKPRGYITTMSDEKSRRCVADLLKDIKSRIYPIGRLDVNSEGLLLFTNDGEFANNVMHPTRHVTKTYRVTVKNDVTDIIAAQLSEGVFIDGKKTAPAQVIILDKAPNRVVMEMIIREGRNRQIRKMCEVLGLEVIRLKRTSIGPIKLGMLKPGTYRLLSKEEVRAIKTSIKKI